MRKVLYLLLLIIAYTTFQPQKAHAYIDPGTGSYLLQLLIAGGVGTTFLIKTQWLKIISIIKRIFGKSKPGDPTKKDDSSS